MDGREQGFCIEEIEAAAEKWNAPGSGETQPDLSDFVTECTAPLPSGTPAVFGFGLVHHCGQCESCCRLQSKLEQYGFYVR